MSDTKHTPGPWFAHEPINPNRRDFGVTAIRPYEPSRGAARRIAWVGNSSNTANNELEGEIRANAALIAAAPDLLALVTECRKQINLIIEDGAPTDWRMWRDDLDAAIAKATQP